MESIIEFKTGEIKLKDVGLSELAGNVYNALLNTLFLVFKRKFIRTEKIIMLMLIIVKGV